MWRTELHPCTTDAALASRGNGISIPRYRGSPPAQWVSRCTRSSRPQTPAPSWPPVPPTAHGCLTPSDVSESMRLVVLVCCLHIASVPRAQTVQLHEQRSLSSQHERSAAPPFKEHLAPISVLEISDCRVHFSSQLETTPH